MTNMPRRHFRLGCGEALDAVATEVERRSPPPTPVARPAGRPMPRLPIGVLSQR
jgi:hypothetical protein